MIDFPASPTVGQAFVDPATGLRWVWDGTKWKASGLATPPLPVAMNDNRLINGDMRIDQRNGGVSGTAVGYTIDRWNYQGAQPSKGGWQRLPSGALLPWFPYCLSFTSSSAYVSLATDFFQFQQPIEADMVSDFAWGTASAQPVTLSFWANSNLTGMFGGSVKNAAGTRSYPFSFSLPTAQTWTKIAITIPGDTAGTWVMSGNAASLYLLFDLGTGSTYRGPANAWAGTTYNGATGAVSVVGTNGGTFSVTGVKLEIGSVATSFNRQSLAKNMADCQRYYSVLAPRFDGYGAAGVSASVPITYPTTMRAAPTITFPSSAYTKCSALSGTNIQTTGAVAYVTVTALGAFNWSPSGGMIMSAEL